MELNRTILTPSAAGTPKPPSLIGPWKLVVFNGAAVLLAAAAGYGSLLMFSGGMPLLPFAAIAAAFLLSSFFGFLFDHHPKRRWAAAGSQILAFLCFFYAVQPGVLFSALAVLLAAFFVAMRRTDAMLRNSLKFKLPLVASSYIKKIFLGFALAGIILYLPQWNSGNVFIPQPQFQKWYDGFAAVSERFYSGINLRASIGTFAEGIARAQLLTNPQFKALPAAEQQKVVNKAVQELIANTGKSIGFPLSAEMSMADAFYKYLSGMFARFKTELGGSFVAAWAVALFVIVWSVGTLGIWLIVIIAYILFEAFAAFNLIHIVGESCTREVVELS